MVTRIPIWLRVLGERIMRIKSYVNGGYTGEGIFTSQGASLTGPLILAGDPVEEMEAVSKDYVDRNNQDLISQGITAESFVSGGVAPALLPAFSGDVSNVQGSNVFNLPVSGVVPGTYPKVEVDAKGLVVSGSELVEDDIPSLPWSKITSGRPTSVSGLGIGDLLSREGGELTGGIEAHAHPANEKNPSTVGYVRGKAEVFPGIYKVGDVVSKATDVTPSGFLKCNGALVDKVIYSELYAVIGDQFNPTTVTGGREPWRQQYGFNSLQSNPLGSWTTETSTYADMPYRHSTIVTKNKVYLLGGMVTSTIVKTILVATIDSNGVIGDFSLYENGPLTTRSAIPVVVKNKVYLIGGMDFKSYMALYTIDSSGNLITSATTVDLPITFSSISVVINTKNKIYVVGNNVSGEVLYSANIAVDGTLNTWTSLPTTLGLSAGNTSFQTNDRVYIVGRNDVFSAKINSDDTLGAFTKTSNNITLSPTQESVVTKNKVYILSTSSDRKVYNAEIRIDGTLGPWVEDASTIGSSSIGVDCSYVVTSSKLYRLGGLNARVSSVPFLGGKNDYSEYYDGTVLEIDPAKFTLPAITSNPVGAYYNYIKY